MIIRNKKTGEIREISKNELDYYGLGGQLNKLGVVNSLWNNIRANRGSGKKPTKQMLEQERKIRNEYQNGGVIVNASGEQHKIYIKPTDRGEGSKGHIMVNHPTMDKGMWDTINLTEKAGVTTIQEGIAATKKWHMKNPYKKQEGGYNFAIGGINNVGFRALPDYVQKKIKSNMYNEGGTIPKEILLPRLQAHMSSDEIQDYLQKYASGGYIVKRSHDRKGKTHVVVGPDGTKKYFGDPNMGERGNSKYGKEAFYARHKHNLENNPYFRAYARTTWQEGGILNNFYKMGGIHINPANKGKFTAWAQAHNMGVQEAARHVMANKEDYSSTIVKRANFAKNFGGRKQEGGYVEGNEYDLDIDEIKRLEALGYQLIY